MTRRVVSSLLALAISLTTLHAATFTVINTNSTGAGSLQQAIIDANAAAGADTISFNITNVGVRTITPTSSLPALTDAVTIDGYTQTGSSANTLSNGNNAVILIRLSGDSAGAGADGFRVQTNNCVIKGLAIGDFSGDGIELNSGTNSRVEGCFLGLDPDGSTPRGNGGNGVLVTTNAFRIIIGGSTNAARCVISANNRGVRFIGSSSNHVQGCFIGTDAGGLLDRGNTNSGVYIEKSTAQLNTIGGTNAAQRNIISGNGDPLSFLSTDRNGITLSAARLNSVLGNYIGTTVNGNVALGNVDTGIRLGSGALTNFIGGTGAGAGNVISANFYGIDFSDDSPDQSWNVVQGNLIGTDSTGTADIGNVYHGITFSFATFNQIGGAATGARNVISGNNASGVNVNCCAAVSNVFQGNFIGVDITGTNGLGNSSMGVDVGSSSCRVGGTNANEGNIIAFNGGGVSIFGFASDCPILGNSIYSNGSLGIDLYTTFFPIIGVTANDVDDVDDEGGDHVQNFPVLSQPLRYPTQTVVPVSLNSLTNLTYRIEFFDNAAADSSGHGQGQTYLGFKNVTTDSSGNVSFIYTNPAALTFGHYLTATATDRTNNTSEFSVAQRIVAFDSVDLGVSQSDSPDPVADAAALVYTIVVTNGGPAIATNVVATDVLPAGVAFLSATTSQGSFSQTNGVVTFTLGNLGVGIDATLTVTVDPPSLTTLSNFVSVAAAQLDNLSANNTAYELTATGVADTGVTISDSPDPVTAGQPITYTVTVTNSGPDQATGVVMSYILDGNHVVTGASVSQGSFNQSGMTFDVVFGTIAVDGSATLTVTAKPTANGTLYHYAYVGSNEADSEFENNADYEETTSDAGPGIVSFSSSNYEVSENVGSVSIDVVRAGGDIGTITVNYASSNLTALSGGDYTAVGGTLTFTNGETSKTILVAIVNDAEVECAESFQMRLFNPTGGAVLLINTNTIVTIHDNEMNSSGTVRGMSITGTNVLTSGNNASSLDLANNGINSAISEDGRYAVFASAANNLVSTTDLNGNWDVFLHDRVTGTNKLISLNTSGLAAANGPSQYPAISADGRIIVFSSTATDLTTNVVNGFSDQIFAYDRLAGTTRLVSVGTNGAGDCCPALNFSLSTNGMRIAFESAADYLSPLDSNGSADVYVRDLSSNATILISVATNGLAAGNISVGYPVVSADGSSVSFSSYSDTLTSGDTNGTIDMFLRNIPAATTTLVSAKVGGGSPDGEGSGLFSRISGTGRYVLFLSDSTNLVAGITNALSNIFLRDTLMGTTVIAGRGVDGALPIVFGGYLRHRALSRDGRYVLFDTTAPNLTPGDTPTVDVFLRDTLSNTTALVSVKLGGGGPGNDGSGDSIMSADGRYVAFVSYATNLTAAARSSSVFDVFLRDMVSGTTTLLSSQRGTNSGANGSSIPFGVGTNGVTLFTSTGSDIAPVDLNFSSDVFARNPAAANAELLSYGYSVTPIGYSFDHQISGDGSRVVFASYGINLVLNDVNNDSDLFIRNVTNNVTTLVSVNSAGTGTGSGYSYSPHVSTDGRYVAFVSNSTNLVANDTNLFGDIFLRDVMGGTTTLVSVKSTGSGSGNSGSTDPDITADGRFIVFASTATNLVVNDGNGFSSDIFIRDMNSNVVQLISFNTVGTSSANSDSYNPVVSSSGRYVAFESYASNLGVADANGYFDVYVRDRQTGSNILCSIGGGDMDSFAPIISADGRFVIFLSYADNLVAGDTNGSIDVFAFNVTNRTLQLVSANSGGAPGNGPSFDPSVSADGRYVTFFSDSSDLVANDMNGSGDIFIRDLVSGTTTLVSVNCSGTGSADILSSLPQISADGRYVSFESYARNLTPGDFSGSINNIFRYDRLMATTVLVSQNQAVTGGGNNNSTISRISNNGGDIAFLSYASDLIANDANGNQDLFAWRAGVTAPAVNLALDKSASTNSVAVPNNFSYTLVVTNVGTAAATGVTVNDTLPSGVSLFSYSTTQGTITNSGNTVIASIGSLGIGSGARVTITVTATAGGTVTNTATTTANESDASLANNTDTVFVSIIAITPPVLSVTLTNSQFVILWPLVTPNVFLLESTTNLNPVVIWTTVTNAVSTNGGNRIVTLPFNATNATRFFRLRQN